MKLETQIKLADAILYAIFGFLALVAAFLLIGGMVEVGLELTS